MQVYKLDIDGVRGSGGGRGGDGKKKLVPLKRGGGRKDEMEELEGGMGGVGYSKLSLGI